jgi:OFA family oxalate/formate antiporter-like MFS transporter
MLSLTAHLVPALPLLWFIPMGSFGGFLGLYPAVTADYFGTKYMGVNYGCMFMAYGVAGLFGPWIAPKLMRVVQEVPYEILVGGSTATKTYAAGNYAASFIIAGVMCLVSILLVRIVRPPAAKG